MVATFRNCSNLHSEDSEYTSTKPPHYVYLVYVMDAIYLYHCCGAEGEC